jgi:hypothetical protein
MTPDLNKHNIRNPYNKLTGQKKNELPQLHPRISTPTLDIPPILLQHKSYNNQSSETTYTENKTEDKREEFYIKTNETCVLSLKPQALKDSNRIVNLPPDLEVLRSVIMSQHTALEPHIKELGRICLDFTINIEKKKQSSIKLMTDNHIPCSLRIKCELTTSPSYENNPDYIELKRELNEAVSDFTRKDLHIMKKWSNINITLLTKDRCFNIMKKAIPIMDGIFTYWVEVFQPLPWPTMVKNNPVLFLSKIYFGTDYAEDTEKTLQYFKLSPAEILLCIAKILTKNNGDTYNTTLIDSIDLNFLEHTNENNLIIINETLTAFDNIIRATTITLWDDNQKKSRLAEASQKLNANLKQTERPRQQQPPH